MTDVFMEICIPKQKKFEDSPPFPAVLSPTPAWSTPSPTLLDFTSTIESQKPYLETLLHERGAILFRGFPLSTASDFNEIVEAFGFSEYPIGQVHYRPKVVGRVFSTNEAPPDVKIHFHHELAFLPESPTKLFFFCEVEPATGGETPIVLSHMVYERMKEKYPEFVGKLEKEGLLTPRVLTEEDDNGRRGWRSTFSTHDKHVAQERASKLGLKLEWIGDGSLARITEDPFPAIKHDKLRNRKVWFNGMAVIYTSFGSKQNDPSKSIMFGNGDPLPSDVVYDCIQIMEEESVAIPWKKGDVLLIDNEAILHARNFFTPPRRILVAFCKS